MLHLNTLLNNYFRTLAFLVYGISFTLGIKISLGGMPDENSDIELDEISISENLTDDVSSSSDDSEEDADSNDNLCPGGCKYLQGLSFTCHTIDFIPSTIFSWTFHYQPPHQEILSDPPRVLVA